MQSELVSYVKVGTGYCIQAIRALVGSAGMHACYVTYDHDHDADKRDCRGMDVVDDDVYYLWKPFN